MKNANVILNSTQYFEELRTAADQLPFEDIDLIAETLLRAVDEGRTTYLFGNGGSAALSSHLACDLGKGTAHCNGKRFRVISLAENMATLTAWANDFGYEDVFSEQLKNLVQPRDVALAISGSGNSRNVLNALQVAREAGATTVGLSGFSGGKMKALCDVCACVPSDNMQIIEDLHHAMAHSIFRLVHDRMAVHTRSTSSCG